jgi:capsular polysaccharide biosynthesis protein
MHASPTPAVGRVGVLQAIRRYPLLFAAPMVALAVLGAVVGYARTPTYKSASELAVGQLNVSDPAAVGSVVTATQSLAAVYSRMIGATEVRQDIAKRVKGKGVPVSATPVPGSPLIRIIASSHTASGAITTANASSDALLKYAEHYSSSSNDSSAVYARYKAASLRVTRQQILVNQLIRSRSTKAAKAQSNLDALKLRRDALKFDYAASQQSARSNPVLRTFSRASSAPSDRASYVEILGLLGLVAGAALGAALATVALKRRVASLMSS